VNTIKGRREPNWSAEDWSRFRYAESFPRLRDALVAWAAHVEAGTLLSTGPGETRNDGRPELHLSAAPHGVMASADGAALPALAPEHAEVIFPASSLQQLSQDRAAGALKGETPCKPLVTAFDRFRAVPRFHYQTMSYDAFQELFERPLKPCLISGMTEDWPMRAWTMQSLATGKYKDSLFKVGKDQDGYRLTMQLRHFLQYMSSARDDLPLYLFESSLETMPVGEQMRQDYVRPHFFATDFFDLVDFNRRPPQRWLTIGSQGSGTNMHTGTSIFLIFVFFSNIHEISLFLTTTPRPHQHQRLEQPHPRPQVLAAALALGSRVHRRRPRHEAQGQAVPRHTHHRSRRRRPHRHHRRAGLVLEESSRAAHVRVQAPGRGALRGHPVPR
jgi:hypothetical protein